MTFDIGLHEVCVRVGVLYVITKFSRMDSLPNFLTHGAPLRARFARARSSAMNHLQHTELPYMVLAGDTDSKERSLSFAERVFKIFILLEYCL